MHFSGPLARFHGTNNDLSNVCEEFPKPLEDVRSAFGVFQQCDAHFPNADDQLLAVFSRFLTPLAGFIRQALHIAVQVTAHAVQVVRARNKQNWGVLHV